MDVDLLPLGDSGQNIIQAYQTRYGLIQFHLSVPGLNAFEDADKRAVTLLDEDGNPVRCLCAQDLLASKLAINRPQDQQDILFLRELLAS